MTAAEQRPAVPDGLRNQVLAASLRARAAGRPPAAPDITAEEAFSRAADAFYGMLGVLPEEDWGRLALRGLDVQGLVGHLTGVEEDVHRCLAGDPQVARTAMSNRPRPRRTARPGDPRRRPGPSGGARPTVPSISSTPPAIPAPNSRCTAYGCRWTCCW